MSATPTPDERTRYSSRREDEVDIRAWPEFDEESRGLLESVGDVIRPEPGELLWDAGDAYDLYLVLAGGICLVDRRDDRVGFVVEAGDFVGELGMLMGQPAFLAGVAMADTTLLRVRIEDLKRLMATSTELSDVLLSAFDARRRLLTRLGEGGLVLAGDDDRDMHRLQEFAERNHVPYRTVLRSDPSAWTEVAATCALPEAGTAVVTGRRTHPDAADDARAGRRRRSRPLRAARPGALRSAGRRRRTGRPGRCRLRGLRRTRRRHRRGRGAGRAGGHFVADRELSRLPTRDLRRRAGPVGDAASGQVRGTAGFASVGDRAVARRRTGSGSGSMTRTTSPPGPSSSPAASSTAGWRSRVSTSSRVAASTTPRPSSRRARVSARTWWWWEAPTRPGRPRCSSRSMSTRCTS